MSRKFGKEFAPRRRMPQTQPGRCDRCRRQLTVHEPRYPAAGIGRVCQPCRDRLAAAARSNAPAVDRKAEATREQAARLVELAAERATPRPPRR